MKGTATSRRVRPRTARDPISHSRRPTRYPPCVPGSNAPPSTRAVASRYVVDSDNPLRWASWLSDCSRASGVNACKIARILLATVSRSRAGSGTGPQLPPVDQPSAGQYRHPPSEVCRRSDRDVASSKGRSPGMGRASWSRRGESSTSAIACRPCATRPPDVAEALALLHR
jgi:hypothetical protein